MVREAVDALGGKATYSEIKDFILSKYGAVNQSTINAQIVVCSVNQPSRVYYPENKRPRICNGPYDFLFSTGRGQVELYVPEIHGTWELRQGEFGRMVVALANDEASDEPTLGEGPELEALQYSFALEAHLRDFIARNLDTIRHDGLRLNLYTDNNNRDGIEYPTDVGPIDILAVGDDGRFVVFELKLSKGSDRALRQILRYMGWVKAKLANGKQVEGIIVANAID
jgi:hypothetical protein